MERTCRAYKKSAREGRFVILIRNEGQGWNRTGVHGFAGRLHID
jgi:hypothetical protein